MKNLLCWIGWHLWVRHRHETPDVVMTMERCSECSKVRRFSEKVSDEFLSRAFGAQVREGLLGSEKVPCNDGLLDLLKHLHQTDPGLLYTGLRKVIERDGLTLSERGLTGRVTDECSKLLKSRMTDASSK